MDKKYIAVMNLTAFHGIGIIDFEYGIDDYCICEYFGGESVKKTKNKMYTDNNGRSYIRKNGSRYYLDEFMKI